MQQPSKKTQPFLVLAIICMGTMLSSYLSSSVNIALTNIMQDLNFTMDSIVWVSLAYMLPYGSILPITGKLGDQFGARRMYMAGLLVFAVGTGLVGLAWNSAAMIIFRIVQGAGAGLLYPNAMAIVARTFPPEKRGQALGIWGALAAGGSALGPIIGGYITEMLHWRVLFYTVLPVALLGIWCSRSLVPIDPPQGKRAPIDYLGGGLLVSALSCLLFALSQGTKEGWDSLLIGGFFAGSTLLFTAFFVCECRVERPLVDLRLFRNLSFTAANIASALSFWAMYTAMFLLPFFLKDIWGYSPIQAGLTLLPMVGTMVFLAPLGGKLADRFGSKLPGTVGMALIAAALYCMHDLAETTPVHLIQLWMILLGTGLSMSMSPLSNGAMRSLPREQVGVGSGVFNMFKNVGGSIGTAMAGAILQYREIFHTQMLLRYIQPEALLVRQDIEKLKTVFVQHGMPSEQTYSAALTVLNNLVTKQAAIASFGDVFLVTAWICLIGVVCGLWLEDAGAQAERGEKPAKAA